MFWIILLSISIIVVIYCAKNDGDIFHVIIGGLFSCCVILSVIAIIVQQLVALDTESYLYSYVNNDDLIIMKTLEPSVNPESAYHEKFSKIISSIDAYNTSIYWNEKHNTGYDKRNIFTGIGYKKIKINPKLDKTKLIKAVIDNSLVINYEYYLIKGEKDGKN